MSSGSARSLARSPGPRPARALRGSRAPSTARALHRFLPALLGQLPSHGIQRTDSGSHGFRHICASPSARALCLTFCPGPVPAPGSTISPFSRPRIGPTVALPSRHSAGPLPSPAAVSPAAGPGPPLRARRRLATRPGLPRARRCLANRLRDKTFSPT